jgi:hypothetical protein
VLEYVLVLTAVIAGVLVAAVNIKTNVRNSIAGPAGALGDANDKSALGKMQHTVESNFNF